MKPAPPLIRTRLPPDMTDLQASLDTRNTAACAAGAFQERLFEVENGHLQSLAQGDTRPPAQLAAYQIDIRTALGGIVAGKWQEAQPRVRSRQLDDQLGELADGEFLRVAEIHRAARRLTGQHESQQSLDQVGHE